MAQWQDQKWIPAETYKGHQIDKLDLDGKTLGYCTEYRNFGKLEDARQYIDILEDYIADMNRPYEPKKVSAEEVVREYGKLLYEGRYVGNDFETWFENGGADDTVYRMTLGDCKTYEEYLKQENEDVK